MSILRSYVSLKSDELKNLHEHTFELVKTLITTYVVLQLKHHMKEGNERIKKKWIRSKLLKLISQVVLKNNCTDNQSKDFDQINC